VPWLTPRGAAALAVAALLAYALARAFPWPVALAIVVLLVGALVVADLVALRGELTIARLEPPRLALARPDAFAYEIVNHAPAPRVVALVEAPAPRLAVALAETRVVVPGRSRVRAEIAVVPRERGATALRSYHARIATTRGIVELRRSWPAPLALRIAPDLSSLDRGALVARTKLLEAGARRLRRYGTGGTFAGLREYGPDDPFRSIDWKASARRGRTMVAQYEVERAQQVVLALDAGRLMTPRLGDRRKLDHAVSAALALAAMARLSADRVGVVAFAASTLARVAPGSGAPHAARLVDALSELEPRFEEADYERAFLDLCRMLRRRSLVVLFSDLLDPAASASLLSAAAALVPRHLVLVVLMTDAALADALAGEPASVADAYRGAVAATLAEERARATAALQARGLLVVDAPATALSVALLDAYVDVKTRGLL
jgi:uncharacterized protein (DUF58 family)